MISNQLSNKNTQSADKYRIFIELNEPLFYKVPVPGTRAFEKYNEGWGDLHLETLGTQMDNDDAGLK